jgi:very-short-patch-repair endonuclease
VGEAEIARLVELQRGFVHRKQLLAAGIGRGAIARRLGSGRLHIAYRDVYLAGRPRVEPFGLATAAIMHFNGSALLSHRTAAAVWMMIESEGEVVELTLLGRNAHRRPGLTVHRAAAIAPADVRRHLDLPVTAPARTLVDLAGCVSALELENALAECRARSLASDTEIRAALARVRGRAGAAKLRAMLDSGAAALTRSKAERKLIALLRAADLPEPLANATVCGHKVDLHWPAQKLVVEFDGWDTHHTRNAFETDRRRDQRLIAAGYRVIRITWWQLEHEPYAVIARIAAALC